MKVIPLAATAALLALTPSAATARLIAPLDVRATATVRPDTSFRGVWNAETVHSGMWEGRDISITEVWDRGARTPTRIRGRAAGGPTRTHRVALAFIRRRTAAGVLTEARPDGDIAPPQRLHCRAHAEDEPGETVGTSDTTFMQIVDQPARNRVVVRGPGVPFLGPSCRPLDAMLPLRRVGILPPRADRPWEPLGAVTPWQLTIGRAEFAAGGTFRFRGRFSLGHEIQDYSGSDVWGSGIMHGKVNVDLVVRRVGR